MERFLASCSAIPVGQSIVVPLEDGRVIALFNVDGNFYALDNSCPHMGGPLGEGELEGCLVTCPWHDWQFNVRNGTCVNMPGDDATSIPIVVRDGGIYAV